MSTSTDWAAFRAQLLPSPDRINLNAGTLSPTPRPVIEAVEALRAQMHARPTEFFVELLPPLLHESRRRLAEYLNCDTAGLLLLPNVTFAMDISIESLPLKPGDEVLLSDHEYGALRMTWNRRARETGAVLRIARIPPDVDSADEIVRRFEAQITERTSILFFSHVTSPTGLIFPAARLCALARRRGIISIVDGAHAPGMIPVDLKAIGADLYGANCHKWMMAAPGCGFLHAAAPMRSLLRPLVVSWGLEYDLARAADDSGWGGSHWHKSFEYMGIFDRCPQCTIGAALDFRAEIGQANVDARVAELTSYARERIEKAGLRCVSRNDPRLTGAMLIFDYRQVPEPTVTRTPWWESRKILAPVTSIGDRYFLRVCCAWFNTEEEIDALAQVIDS
jgi:isopenicillin-N epimerase